MLMQRINTLEECMRELSTDPLANTGVLNATNGASPARGAAIVNLGEQMVSIRRELVELNTRLVQEPLVFSHETPPPAYEH